MTTAQRLANLSQDYGVIPMSNRNYAIDGAMEYFIGGTTALSGSGGVYTCNAMWKGAAGTAGVATVLNGNIRGNADLSGFDTGPNGCYMHQQTTASTGSFATQDLPMLYQFLEGVNKFAGRSVTLSAKMWVNSGTVVLPGIIARQAFGSGGSPSANVILDKAVNWTIGMAAKRFSVRLDFPNLSGKTLGTNNNDNSTIGFWLPGNWTGTLNISEIQVELSNPMSSSDINGAGGEPTAFEYRGPQAELSRVQRLYHYMAVPQYCGNFPLLFYNTTNGQVKVYSPQIYRSNPAFSVTGAGVWYPTIGGGTISGMTLGPITGNDVTLAVTGTGFTPQAATLSNSSTTPFVLTFDARL